MSKSDEHEKNATVHHLLRPQITRMNKGIHLD